MIQVALNILLVAALVGSRRSALSPIVVTIGTEALRAFSVVGGVVSIPTDRSHRRAIPLVFPVPSGGSSTMALKFNQVIVPAAPAVGSEDRPKAQVYLNVGITIPVTNAETGETEDTFVSLPFGLGLDTMSPMEQRGNSTNWNHMVQAKNWLLEQLQSMATGVKPGEVETIEGLEIQIRRVGQAVAPNADANPFLAAMSGRLSVVK